MDLVIKNGTIVTATESYQADIGVEGETIALIGRNLAGDEIIDAQGMYVMPGGIDPHTHLELPFMGSVSADDFRTGTIAAACGGTTTIIDFAIQGAGQTLREALDIWLAKAAGKASIDYGMHMAIGAMDDERMAEMGDMVDIGVPSFKVFMAYKGSLMVDDETLFRSLIRAKESRDHTARAAVLAIPSISIRSFDSSTSITSWPSVRRRSACIAVETSSPPGMR